MSIPKDEIQAWCWYLAAIHQAAGAGGRKVMLPIAYQCTRRPDSQTGCGTCYHCTKELIARALYASTCPMADLDAASSERAGAVLAYVTGLDERLNAPDGLGDDYTAMDSTQFVKVMNWAAELIPMPGTVGSSAYAAFAAETGMPHLVPLDLWGRVRCLETVHYADTGQSVQCALVAGHEEPCDPLPTVPRIPPLPYEDGAPYDHWRPTPPPRDTLGALLDGVAPRANGWQL